MTLFACVLLGIIAGILLACTFAPFILSGCLSEQERIDRAKKRIEEMLGK